MEKTHYGIGVSNYYGEVYAVDNKDGSYHLELDSYSSTSIKNISKELFEMIVKELCNKE